MDYKNISNIDTNAVTVYLVIFGVIFGLVALNVFVFILIALWRIFVKAGRPGWYALIPIFNVYIMLKIVKKPTWLTLVFFIPYLGIIPQIIISLELGKAFGKSTAFSALWLLVLPFGFFTIAFDDSKYLYGAKSNHTPNPNDP